MDKPEEIKLLEEPVHDCSDIPSVALESRGREFFEDNKRQTISAYYACISFMDAQVGFILDAMDRLKLWENTIVVFLSDNGYHLGEHGGLWGKGTLFEESVGTPPIITMPNLTNAGSYCERTVELVDIYPTLVELCNLPQPKQRLQGESLVKLLIAPGSKWDKPAITILRKRGIMGHSVRTEQFRYTQWAGGRLGVELYDHTSDPL